MTTTKAKNKENVFDTDLDDNIQDAAVGDGGAVSISGKVCYGVPPAVERLLYEHVPPGIIQFCQELFPLVMVAEMFCCARECKPIILAELFKFPEKELAESTGDLTFRAEKVIIRYTFELYRAFQPSTRH